MYGLFFKYPANSFILFHCIVFYAITDTPTTSWSITDAMHMLPFLTHPSPGPMWMHVTRCILCSDTHSETSTCVYAYTPVNAARDFKWDTTMVSCQRRWLRFQRFPLVEVSRCRYSLRQATCRLPG